MFGHVLFKLTFIKTCYVCNVINVRFCLSSVVLHIPQKACDEDSHSAVLYCIVFIFQYGLVYSVMYFTVYQNVFHWCIRVLKRNLDQPNMWSALVI